MPEFVALAETLRVSTGEEIAPPAPAERETTLVDDAAPLNEFALARLAALEAYERAVPRLLATLASDVLGRELALAPVDLAALSARTRARFAAEEPLALWVSPADAARVPPDVPVRSDAALAAGDVVLEVRDGEIDLRFCVRLAEALGTALVER